MPERVSYEHPTNEKERYQEAADTLARLLQGQTIFIDSVKLIARAMRSTRGPWDIFTA